MAPGVAPGAPTDPDVRNSRIRLFGPWVRYVPDAVRDARRRQRIAAPAAGACASHVIGPRCERRLSHLSPDRRSRGTEAPSSARRFPVTPKYAKCPRSFRQGALLLLDIDGGGARGTTRAIRCQRAAEAVLGRLALHHPACPCATSPQWCVNPRKSNVPGVRRPPPVGRLGDRAARNGTSRVFSGWRVRPYFPNRFGSTSSTRRASSSRAKTRTRRPRSGPGTPAPSGGA